MSFPIMMTSLVAQTVKHLPIMWETRVRSLDQEDPLEKQMATHSIILAWEIPWTEEPRGLSPWCCKRAGHDLVTEQQEELEKYTTDSPNRGEKHNSRIQFFCSFSI